MRAKVSDLKTVVSTNAIGMNIYQTPRLLIVGFFVFSLQACSKFVEDTNVETEDPDASTLRSEGTSGDIENRIASFSVDSFRDFQALLESAVAESDFIALYKFVQKMPDEKQATALNELSESWIRFDSTSALNHVLRITNESDQGDWLVAIALGMGERNLHYILQWITDSTFKSSGSFPAAADKLFASIDTSNNREVLLKFLDSLSNPSVRKSQLNRLLSNWANSNPEDALNWALTNASDLDLGGLIRKLHKGWLQSDPEAALNGLLSSRNDKMDEDTKMELVTYGLRKMASENLSQALEWTQNQTGDTQNAALLGLAREWGKASPENAAVFAENMQESKSKTYFTAGVMDEWVIKSPEEAIAWASKQSVDRSGNIAINAVNKLASQDLSKAKVLIPTIEREDIRNVTSRNVAGMVYSEQGSEAAMDYIRTLDPEIGKEAAPGLAHVWAKYDFDGAEEWVDSLDESSGRSYAYAELAVIIGPENPKKALELTNDVVNSEIRARLLSRYLGHWALSSPEKYEELRGLGNISEAEHSITED